MSKKAIYMEDAIAALRKEMHADKDLMSALLCEGVGAVLKRLPSAQPEQLKMVQDILQYLDEYLHPIVSPEHWSVYSVLYDMVSVLPSAQPEIIRCGDCMHNGSFDTDCPIYWPGKEFCNFAERKDDE